MTSEKAWEIYRTSLGDDVHLSDEEQFLVDEALDYLIRSAWQPVDELCGIFNQACNYYKQGYKQLALKYYEYGAQRHDDSICYSKAGAMCYHGDGVPVDYEKAFRYLSKAYEHYWYKKSNLLAEMYEKGIYVEKNPERAEEIWNHYYEDVALQAEFSQEVKARQKESMTDR